MFKNLIEEIKLNLMNRATGKEYTEGFDDARYIKIKSMIFSHPILNKIENEILSKCNFLSEFWPFIKAKFPSYAERRLYISNEFDKMLKGLIDTMDTMYDTYEKLEKLGAGGFGEVYKFRNTKLNTFFAFKFLTPTFQENKEKCLQRFIQESNILFKLRHKSIIHIHDIGVFEDTPWIKMEYFEGKDLNKVLMETGKIAPKKALILIKEISDALNYAQKELNIVHRDLKPSNIMVAPKNNFRIIDFGLGAYIENDSISRLTTGSPITWGSHFTAPELISDPKLLNYSLDVYSAGAIWYNILTNRPPAGASIVDEINAIEGVTEEYKRIIIKCLKNAEQRYKNFDELVIDLSKLE